MIRRLTMVALVAFAVTAFVAPGSAQRKAESRGQDFSGYAKQLTTMAKKLHASGRKSEAKSLIGVAKKLVSSRNSTPRVGDFSPRRGGARGKKVGGNDETRRLDHAHLQKFDRRSKKHGDKVEDAEWSTQGSTM